MVLAVVKPFGRHSAVGEGVGLEGFAVEVADEILCGAAAEGASGIDVAEEHPFLFIGAVNGELEEVGTFPHTVLAAEAFAECALEGPVAEVGRGEYEHLVVQGMCKGEHPLAALLVPEHVGVAGFAVESDYGVAGKFGEGHAVVGAVSHALYLAGIGRGIECYHGIFAETGSVVAVNDR